MKMGVMLGYHGFAAFREAVNLAQFSGAAPLPLGGHVALALEPVQQRVDGSLAQLKACAGGAPKGLADSVAVHGPGVKQAQNQHRQMPFEKFFIHLPLPCIAMLCIARFIKRAFRCSPVVLSPKLFLVIQAFLPAFA